MKLPPRGGKSVKQDDLNMLSKLQSSCDDLLNIQKKLGGSVLNIALALPRGVLKAHKKLFLTNYNIVVLIILEIVASTEIQTPYFLQKLDKWVMDKTGSSMSELTRDPMIHLDTLLVEYEVCCGSILQDLMAFLYAVDSCSSPKSRDMANEDT